MVFALLACAASLMSTFGDDITGVAQAETISGAGATFPYPIYSKWAAKYRQQTDLKMTYQAIGSGGGIKKIKAKEVDFGASDKPLKSEELYESGLIQFPMIVGGVVPVLNIKGVRRGKLKVTPEILTDIFLGNIKKWNDRRIKAVNSRLKLPDEEITVVHRSEGSGTTWIFTSYLSKVSEEWKEKVGAGKKVDWPVGMEAKGNPGVSALIKKVDGSIGYVGFAYALEKRLTYVKLQNQHGEFVKPTIKAFQAAAG